jgi:site-specific DNA recombinase
MAQTAATTAPHAAGTTGALRAWATAAAARTVEVGLSLLRFAFYGRYSTEDRQNPATSYAWQHDQAGSPRSTSTKVSPGHGPGTCARRPHG